MTVTPPAVMASAIKPEWLVGPRKLFAARGIATELVHEDGVYYLVNIPLWNTWRQESVDLRAMAMKLKPCGVARIKT
jgi:hypothetical protein